MEYILYAVCLAVTYKVITTLFKKRETDFYTGLHSEYFSSSTLSFSLKDWKGCITNIIDDGCYKNYYEVRRTAPMVWQWRKVDIADHSAGSASRLPVGIEYIVERTAYEELLEIDGYHSRLSNANKAKQMVSFYRHTNETDPSITVIEKAGLLTEYEALVEKARVDVMRWENIDHPTMVQLEQFFSKNHVA